MNAEAVVITGIGMLTPLGTTAAATAQAWQAGLSAVRSRLDQLKGTVLAQQDVAVLPEFDAAQRLGSRKMMKFMSDAAVLGCLAAREALAEAEVKKRFCPERVGLFAGTGLAGLDMREVMPMIGASLDHNGSFSCRNLGSQGLAAANPLLSFKILANMPPCLISIIEVVKGPNFLFTPWEGQAAAALREAWFAVASGDVDCALAGGADNAATPTAIAYLRKTGLLKDGECASAGAAYVVMERLSSALDDGRNIYGKVAEINICPTAGDASDPLADRIGRTYAAAPAILLGLAARSCISTASLIGADCTTVEIRVEKIA